MTSIAVRIRTLLLLLTRVPLRPKYVTIEFIISRATALQKHWVQNQNILNLRLVLNASLDSYAKNLWWRIVLNRNFRNLWKDCERAQVLFGFYPTCSVWNTPDVGWRVFLSRVNMPVGSWSFSLGLHCLFSFASLIPIPAELITPQNIEWSFEKV